MFTRLLEVVPRCEARGLDLSGHDAGDGPAVLVVFLLGAIVVGLAIAVEIAFAPPLWVHAVVWLPVTLGGAILLLRPLKAWLVAQEYRHRALGSGGS